MNTIRARICLNVVKIQLVSWNTGIYKAHLPVFLNLLSLRKKMKIQSTVLVIAIYRRSQTSYTAPCNGDVSHGAQIGDLRLFTDHARKNNAKPMHLRSLRTVRYFTRVLSSRSDRSRCTWWTAVISITGKPEDPQFERKTWRPPIWAPCQEKNGAGSGISSVFLWC